MRSLLIILILLTVAACTPDIIKGAGKIEPPAPVSINPYFSDFKKDYVYHARIVTPRVTFSGILAVKRTGEDKHRIVFTSGFGNKIFDFALEREVFTVNYIAEGLDKMFILRLLQNDFRTLVQIENPAVAAFTAAEEVIYRSPADKRNNFYRFRADTLRYITQTRRAKEKLTVEFSEVGADFARKISIRHRGVDLKIDLEAL